MTNKNVKRLVALLPWRDGTQDSAPAVHDVAPTPRAQDDDGSSLILALIFLVVIGTIVGAMASWTANALSDTLVFNQTRTDQAALSSATNVAIQNIRYTPLIGNASGPQTLNANPPSVCFGSSSTSTVTTQGIAVDVWCSTVWNPTSANTRVVTVSACLSSIDGGNPSQCVPNPGLQTVVTFDDYSAQSPTVSLAQCQSPPAGTCGSGMTISSSLLGVTPPSVASLSPTSGPATGTGTMTITGTGFEANSTSVSFVGTTASQNLNLSGTNVNVTSSTSLTVTIPPATTVTTYDVVVTTPNGTSPIPTSGAPVYTYNPVVPTVSGLTSTATNAAGYPTGSAAGGSTVTISGSGFLSSVFGDSTTVEFIDTANSNNVYTAPSSTIVLNTTGTPGTQLTVATPAISSTDLDYYVVVVTAPGGPSGTTGPIFEYQPLLPLVASAVTTSGGSTQGGPGTSLTITGVGFVAGTGNTTIQLVPTSGSGTTLNLTNITVTGSTSLTGTLPSGGKANSTYYVEATTASGSSGSSGAPQFTYT